MAGRSDVDLSQEGELEGSEEEVVAPRRVAHLTPPPPSLPPTPLAPPPRTSVAPWVIAAGVLLGLGAMAVVLIVVLGGVGVWAASQAAG